MALHQNPFRSFLDHQGFVILDGGLASELEFRGARLNDTLWSTSLLVNDPLAIFEVHYDYLRSGADVLISASYQATFEGLAKLGKSSSEARAVFHQSISLAQEARSKFWAEESIRGNRIYPLIAASIGPYGAFLADGSEYSGQYGLSERALMDFHRPRLLALMEAGPDLLAFETIPCLTEARAIIRLLDAFPEQVAYLSFSCRDGQHLSSGELFKDAVRLATSSAQLVGVGINCTAPHFISSLLHSVEETPKIPFIVYPNSGEGWDAQKKCWIPGSQQLEIADKVAEWYALGVRVFGGCCRTRPTDISAIRNTLNNSVLTPPLF